MGGWMLAAGGYGAAGQVEGGQEQRLKYHRIESKQMESGEGIVMLNWRDLLLSEESLEEGEKPRFKSAKPLFAEWSSPLARGGYVQIALDQGEKTDRYERLYIDVNGDGKLADETAVAAYRADSRSTLFGPVKIILSSGKESWEYHLFLEYYPGKQSNPAGTLKVASGCWYEGEIKVEGKAVNCKVFDYNVDGVFNDESLDTDQCDRVQIGQETGFVGESREVEGKYFKMEVAREGARVVVKPTEKVEWGQIKVQEDMSFITAVGEKGAAAARPKKGMARLPVGKYQAQSWQIEKKDEKGDVWEAAGRVIIKKNDYEVRADKVGEWDMGEPLRAVMQITRKGEKSYEFKQQIQGRHGELVLVTRNKTRPIPPVLHIRNEEGSYDKKISFEFG